ncbi:MAG: division/cell wall cluster transcriptional repressor MraZ [Ruminococcus sp.]|nr:division/cell wall cluster transcriptional repressor MraZ [Ruminococcus sp.]
MFSGMSSHSIDSKGRIVLPAKFREELGDTFYLARGFNNTCIQAISAEEYKNINAKIDELPANLSMALQYTFSATAQEVTPNAQGRVIIPQKLREFADISDEALVVGMNKRVEIWNSKNFEEFIASQQANIEQAMSMLKL